MLDHGSSSPTSFWYLARELDLHDDEKKAIEKHFKSPNAFFSAFYYDEEADKFLPTPNAFMFDWELDDPSSNHLDFAAKTVRDTYKMWNVGGSVMTPAAFQQLMHAHIPKTISTSKIAYWLWKRNIILRNGESFIYNENE